MKISFKIHTIILKIWNLVKRRNPNTLDIILSLSKIVLTLLIVGNSLFIKFLSLALNDFGNHSIHSNLQESDIKYPY
jgi:hypothetical protein